MRGNPDTERLVQRELVRRNSVVRIVRGADGLSVEKTYHARYTAKQEYDAYLALDPVLAISDRVRRPVIRKVDERRNTIHLEYVDAPDLRKSYLQHGVATLDAQRHLLIPLFAKARSMDVRFDSDPANFLVADGGDELVIVDPVAVELDLVDFNAVVFLWGLIKSFLGNRRWHTIGAFTKCWRRYYTAYLDAVGITSRELNAQLARYIDVVIGWNLNESGGESLAKRGFRRFVMVPIWRITQLPFRLNLVKAMR